MIKNVLAVALAAITTASISHADVPAVAVDIAPVHSLVAQVMGTLGNPQLVVTPGASPHGYSMRPSEAKALQDADIVFWVSSELTPWLAETVDTLSQDARQVELLEVPGATKLLKRESALFEKHDHHDDEEEDHAENDEEKHDKVDAHGWLAPSNAAIWLDNIAEELSKMDPEHANVYSANAAMGKTELETVKSDVNTLLTPVRGRSFIVFHDAYQYFENAFEIPASGAISLGDATKPGPARIQQIHDRVAAANVTCVLSEPQYNPDLVDTVLDGTDARTSVIDPLGTHLEIGAGLYPQLLRDIAKTLADCV